MRLDRYLANNGFGSRSEVRKLLSSGKVKLDGNTVRDGSTDVAEGSVVSCGGIVKSVEAGFVCYMLNKPAGTVTAATDPDHRTVMELFAGDIKDGLNPVGRLDKDTEGLLIVTDDGELGHFLTSPRRNVPKKYYAMLDGIPGEDGIRKVEEGIAFKEFTSRPAVMEIISRDEDAGSCEVFITVTEGRFHEVKRLMAAIGCNVRYLKRVAFGSLELDEALAPGSYRRLDEEEVRKLLSKL